MTNILSIVSRNIYIYLFGNIFGMGFFYKLNYFKLFFYNFKLF
jgi:hypothetical protein